MKKSFAHPTWFVSYRYDHMKNCRPCNYNEEELQEFFYLLMQFSPLPSEARTALLLICKFSLSPGFISHFILGNKGKIQLGSLFRANDSLQITHWVYSLYYWQERGSCHVRGKPSLLARLSCVCSTTKENCYHLKCTDHSWQINITYFR